MAAEMANPLSLLVRDVTFTLPANIYPKNAYSGGRVPVLTRQGGEVVCALFRKHHHSLETIRAHFLNLWHAQFDF